MTTRDVLEILNLTNASTVSKYVKSGKLTPSRKLGGRTRAFLFWKSEVERLAAQS